MDRRSFIGTSTVAATGLFVGAGLERAFAQGTKGTQGATVGTTAGTVRGLGVTTLEPTRLVPNVPSVAQSGLPGFEVLGWNGLVAPAGTPAPVIARLNKELREIVADPVVYGRLRSFGFDAFTSTPAELDEFVKIQLVKWTKMIKDAGIAAQ